MGLAKVTAGLEQSIRLPSVSKCTLGHKGNQFIDEGLCDPRHQSCFLLISMSSLLKSKGEATSTQICSAMIHFKGRHQGAVQALWPQHHFIPTVCLFWCLVFSGMFFTCFHSSDVEILKSCWRAGLLWAHSSLLRFFFFLLLLKPSSKFQGWTGVHPCIKHEEKIIFEFLWFKDLFIPEHRRPWTTVRTVLHSNHMH